jgi:hypothetical protein
MKILKRTAKEININDIIIGGTGKNTYKVLKINEVSKFICFELSDSHGYIVEFEAPADSIQKYEILGV